MDGSVKEQAVLSRINFTRRDFRAGSSVCDDILPSTVVHSCCFPTGNICETSLSRKFLLRPTLIPDIAHAGSLLRRISRK